MVGYIILRDIPKERVQLDLTYFDVQGGFRGFAHVPQGPHYISILVDGNFIAGFWCYVNPSEVLVKVYDHENKCFNDDTENLELYTDLALSGAMNKSLISVMQVDAEMSIKWLTLVSFINKDNFPPKMKTEEVPSAITTLDDIGIRDTIKTRFEITFETVHESNQESFLTEFQYVFVNYLVNNSNEPAINRWLYLLTTTYNAREDSMKKYPDFFVSFINVLIDQLKLLPDNYFSANSLIFQTANYMIEDLIDTGLPQLVEKAGEFQTFLKTKGL